MFRRALPLLLFTCPVMAQVNSPDLDVYTPFRSPNLSGYGAQGFDADWTADGRLAVAWVEQGYKGDLLVLAVHDPRPGAAEPWQVLGSFGSPGWAFGEPALAVPSALYGDPQHDRMYVAIGARAGTNQNLNAKAVRLVSVALDGSEGAVRVASPPDPTPRATHHLYVGDLPSVALTPATSWSDLPEYQVDLLFHDPDGFDDLPQPTQPLLGGHLMLSRSFDYGLKLTPGDYLTGPKAIALGGAPSGQYEAALDTRVSAAGDALNARTWIALEDRAAGRVDLLSSPYQKAGAALVVALEWTSPRSYGAESEPRIACNHEGDYAFTYLTPSSRQASGSDVHWYVGSFWSGPIEMQVLRDPVWSPADIDLRGNDARIAANALVDGGKAAEPAFFEASINNRIAIPVGVAVADQGQGLGAPVAACAPRGTPSHEATLFRSRAQGRGPIAIWLDE